MKEKPKASGSRADNLGVTKRRSLKSHYRSGVRIMKKLFKILKVVAIVLVCALVLAHWPELAFGAARAIVWTARTITGVADGALAMVVK